MWQCGEVVLNIQGRRSETDPYELALYWLILFCTYDTLLFSIIQRVASREVAAKDRLEKRDAKKNQATSDVGRQPKPTN